MSSGAAPSIAASVLLSRSRRALHEWYTIRAPDRAAPLEFFLAAFHSRAHRHRQASSESTDCLFAAVVRRPMLDETGLGLVRRVPQVRVQWVRSVRPTRASPTKAPAMPVERRGDRQLSSRRRLISRPHQSLWSANTNPRRAPQASQQPETRRQSAIRGELPPARYPPDQSRAGPAPATAARLEPAVKGAQRARR